MTEVADRVVGERRTPTADELATWRWFLRAHATITRALENELEAAEKLSLASYDVLVQLAEAPDRRLRMTELADAVLLSRSGVTRLVDRLERMGLVSRCPVESDGRGVAARLTDAGFARLRTASRVHLTGVQRHFVTRLDPQALEALEGISRRLSL
ncbi:MarR family winged helix-turn-helix transcriptional regulator [Pseudonocardia sp. CA-107938]|uniref:MarR family winged helix-turn-helix transcriptional regulator n=1 Tax=Pseudonocardia sp. CA-107938 TaxID=3240021 RepID=UPI003D91B020